MVYLQVALNGILLGGFYLLLAQGLNLVFGVMRIVNIAHGAFVVIAGLIVYTLSRDMGIHPLLALPLVMVLMFFVGAAVQWLVIERIGGEGAQHELLTLMATFGLAYILINIGQEIWGSEFKSVPYLQDSLTLGELRFSAALLVGFGLAVGLAAALAWWLGATRTGKGLRATSQSTLGAESCGLDVRRIRMIGFALGTALAAAAGVLLILTQAIAPPSAINFTIVAFVVVALGGLGNYAGAAVGAAVVGLAQTFAGYELGGVAQSAVPYVLLIGVMLLRPDGILPKRAAQ